jgi:hypothetical protein
VGLGVFAPMLERIEQFRIQTCHTSEVLGVDLIRLTLIGVDELEFAGIGHQDLVAAPL